MRDNQKKESRVTEHHDNGKQAEERLGEYESVVEGLEDMIAVVDRDYRYLMANPAFLNHRGMGRDQVIGHCIAEVLDPEIFGKIIKQKLDECFQGRVVKYEMRYTYPKLGERDLLLSYFPIEGPGGVERAACILQDITEYKRAEEELRRAKEFSEQLIHTANVIVLGLDMKGRINIFNQTAERITGYTFSELEGKSWFETLVPKDKYPHAWEEFSRLVANDNVPSTFENSILTKNGEERYITWRNNQVRMDGKVVGTISFGNDVTERKRAEMERDVISELIQSVNLTSNLDELLTQVHQSLKKVLYAENCCVALHDKQTGLFEAPFFVDLVEANPFPMALSKNCTAKVFSSGQPLLMNEAVFAELLDRGEVDLIGRPAPSFLAVPLMTPTETIGVIVVQHYEKDNVYSQRDVEFLSAVAAQLALAIERKRAEEALIESEERYRDLVENSREFICTHDLNGVILSANRAASEMLGYDLKDYCGQRNFRDLLVPEVRDQFDDYLTRIRRDGVASGLTLLQTSSGDRRILEYQNTVRTEGVDTPIVRGMARDITEQRRAEKAMSDLRRELELTMNSMEEGVHRVDLKGDIVFENPAAARMLGWEIDELLGKPGHLTMHHTRQDGTPYPIEECPIYATLRDGLSRDVADEVFWRQDGTSFPVEYMSAPMRNDRNEIVAIVVTFRDITERKQAEEALRQSEERYRELFENAKDAIYVHDLSGRYTSVNRAAEQLSGFTREEILGKHFSNFVSPRDLKHVRTNLCRKLDEENETIYEVDLVTRAGRRVPVEISSRLIYEEGVAVGIQGTARDITDRKRAQEALRIYSQRLIQAQEAERQKIARELHDEIGQVLTAVRINLQSIQRSGGTNENVPRLDESIRIVDEALGQVRELSIELRPSLLDDLGLPAALRWYVDRYAQRTGIIAEVLDGFEVDGRLPRDLETACFRIAQEALTNVARHAQAASVSVQLERARERMVLIIIDDGVGFDLDKLRKSASAASALGLRGMEERALAVGGYIEIDSGLERGTRIRATFPLKRK